MLLALPIAVVAQATSYDADGDGKPDSTDHCAYVKGMTDKSGCPYPIKITADDRDGDGVPDVRDKCADLFGVKENNGCPDLTRASSGESAIPPTGKDMFTTSSSTVAEDAENFKNTLHSIINDAVNNIDNTPKQGNGLAAKQIADKCLPKANECYLTSENGKTYYADYGKYSTEATAAQKYYALKQKLSESLNKTEWKSSEIAKGGYIDRYQMISKSGSAVVAVHVNHANGKYAVYITVTQKNK